MGEAPVKSSIPVTKNDYTTLANFLTGRDSSRILKREPHSETLRTAAEYYGNRAYIAAYESVKPVYDQVVANMQRVLARNLDFEANKLAREQRKPVAAARENVLQMRAHAQQVIDQFERLLQDLQSKPLVRHHIRKGASAAAMAAGPSEEAPATTMNSANETQIDPRPVTVLPAAHLTDAGEADELAADLTPGSPTVIIGERRYTKAPYAAPEIGALYAVRDKAGSERIVRVIAKSPDGTSIQVVKVVEGKISKTAVELPVESLAYQARKGWCSRLIAVEDEEAANVGQPDAAEASSNATMRIDSQNFGRCCGDVVRAKINFNTQSIKDVGDGPFRAGKYEQAFLNFEQLAVGFNSAVAASRREIAEGRRQLTAEKGNLSGKEIQERTAAYIRSEQLIHTAEREFSTILEGLRMYLRAEQG
jgi:hypothetical protein